MGFFYTPILFLCGACILAAFHRSAVVADQPLRTRLFSYTAVFAITTLICIGAIRAIHTQLKTMNVKLPSAAEIATAVWDDPRRPAPQQPVIIQALPPKMVPIAQTNVHRRQLELQPYQDKAPRWYVEGKKINARIGFSNGGTEPAQAFIGQAQIRLFRPMEPISDGHLPSKREEGKMWDEFINARRKEIENPNIGKTLDAQDGVTDWGSQYTDALTQADVDDLIWGRQLLYIFSVAQWRDVAGIHIREYCSFLQPPMLKQPELLPVEHYCNEHNSTRDVSTKRH